MALRWISDNYWCLSLALIFWLSDFFQSLMTHA
jgi:hypothetical protein